jgi:hypothetical protein
LAVLEISNLLVINTLRGFDSRRLACGLRRPQNGSSSTPAASTNPPDLRLSVLFSEIPLSGCVALPPLFMLATTLKAK